MNKKLGFVFSAVIIFSIAMLGNSVFAITDPAVKYPSIDLYLEDDALVWQPPEWFQPEDQATAPEDIEHWKNVLPYPQDRNEDMYLVIPGLGLVTPIVPIPSGTPDFENMLNGRNIPINNYLQEGIIEYVSSVEPGYEGKRIDFGHSNYFKSDPGRYKTIFANLMWLDAGDQAWYYVRQADGSYDLRKYEVTASYPTDPGNVEALQWDEEGADALIFGCYNGLNGRWMVEATYMGEPMGQRTQQAQNDYSKIPQPVKNRLSSAVKVMSHLSIQTRKYQIIVLYNGIKKARAGLETTDPDFELKQQVLDFLEDHLAEIYPS